MKCYIVYGNSGEYADYATWNICVKKNKSSAEKLVQKLIGDLERLNIPNCNDVMMRSGGPELLCQLKYDKNAIYTSYGIEYGIEETIIT